MLGLSSLAPQTVSQVRHALQMPLRAGCCAKGCHHASLTSYRLRDVVPVLPVLPVRVTATVLVYPNLSRANLPVINELAALWLQSAACSVAATKCLFRGCNQPPAL